MRLRYRARALADIDDIFRYFEKRSSSLADQVLREIHAAVQFIREHPYGSPQTDDGTVRMKLVLRYRYKIFYSIIDDDTVEIIHVRHGSRRPWRGEGN